MESLNNFLIKMVQFNLGSMKMINFMNLVKLYFKVWLQNKNKKLCFERRVLL